MNKQKVMLVLISCIMGIAGSWSAKLAKLNQENSVS